MLRALEHELEKIREIGDQDVRDMILRFYESLRFEQLSESRILFHVLKARVINDKIGLLPLNTDKARQCVTWILNQDYKAWTIAGYKLFLRKFWVFLNGDEIPMDVKALLKIKKPWNNDKKPDDLISEDELRRLIEAAHSFRDKAVIQLLYDSGIRSEELRTLRLGDVEFLTDRMRLKVNGKTGSRVVVVIGDSMRILKDYINAYSIKDKSAWLFQGQNGPMTAAILHKILNVTAKRAEVRHVYPHLFRYTRATILAKSVSEAPLESQMGWRHGSTMTRIYVKLSLRDQEQAIMGAYSKSEAETQKIRIEGPKICPRCSHENSVNSGFCSQCGFNLNAKIDEAINQDLTINDALAELEKLKSENEEMKGTVRDIKELFQQYAREIEKQKKQES